MGRSAWRWVLFIWKLPANHLCLHNYRIEYRNSDRRNLLRLHIHLPSSSSSAAVRDDQDTKKPPRSRPARPRKGGILLGHEEDEGCGLFLEDDEYDHFKNTKGGVKKPYALWSDSVKICNDCRTRGLPCCVCDSDSSSDAMSRSTIRAATVGMDMLRVCPRGATPSRCATTAWTQSGAPT
jgi:hypothetical protein